MKKVIGFFVVLLLLMRYTCAMAEGTLYEDGWYYRIFNGYAVIDAVDCNYHNTDTLVVPKRIGVYEVKLADSLFGGSSGLQYKIYDLSNINDLSDFLFDENSFVEEVILPIGIEEIPIATFDGCHNLKFVKIPSTVTVISDYAFRNSGIESITIPENVCEIKRIAFVDCNNLQKIVFEEGCLSKIGELDGKDPVFSNIAKNAKVYLPDTITFIGENEFKSSVITRFSGGYVYGENIEGLTFYSNKNSYAEKYASERGIAFIPLEKEINATINGTEIEYDSKPYIKNDRTLVPMRAIFEALGAEVSWDDATKTAIGVKDGTEVKITIGEDVLYKNGETVALDCAAEITNDRTMVPVRAISEAFGCTVNWNNETKTVEITN